MNSTYILHLGHLWLQAFVPPRRTKNYYTIQRSNFLPQREDILTQRSNLSPQRANILTQRSNLSPQWAKNNVNDLPQRARSNVNDLPPIGKIRS